MSEESGNQAQQAREDRLYLCDIGDSEDAFLVCGGCINEHERDVEIYTEMDPLPEHDHDRKKRECKVCDQMEAEIL